MIRRYALEPSRYRPLAHRLYPTLLCLMTMSVLATDSTTAFSPEPLPTTSLGVNALTSSDPALEPNTGPASASPGPVL